MAYFEDQSRKLFDREVPQVLLVHANALNAHCIDRLLAGLREQGYDFVPLADALADPAYASADTFTGRGGISWLHRWALSRGCKRDFFGDEPEVPRWVCEIDGVEANSIVPAGRPGHVRPGLAHERHESRVSSPIQPHARA